MTTQSSVSQAQSTQKVVVPASRVPRPSLPLTLTLGLGAALLGAVVRLELWHPVLLAWVR